MESESAELDQKLDSFFLKALFYIKKKNQLAQKLVNNIKSLSADTINAILII